MTLIFKQYSLKDFPLKVIYINNIENITITEENVLSYHKYSQPSMPEGAQAGYLKALFSQNVFPIFTCHVSSLSTSFFLPVSALVFLCQRQRINNYSQKF